MRIFIERYSDTVFFDGKSLFCNRLGMEIVSRGYFVTGDESVNVDVSLNVVQLKHDRSDIKVLRLDGVCFDLKKDYKSKNLKLRQSLLRADGVIYQSRFSKSMCDKFLGESISPNKIIYNGADLSFYDKIKPAKVRYKNVYVAISRWRIFKRLKETIECFLEAAVDNSVLYIAGDIKDSSVNPKDYCFDNIIFLGEIDQRTLASYLKIAKASIHLSWFDSCPNSVVEAVAAKVPVICGNISGPREIVGPSGGYCCITDDFYDYSAVDVYNPPAILKQDVVTAIRLCAELRSNIKNSHVDIKHVADKYMNFFENLWKG